jgi:hypothetical protein
MTKTSHEGHDHISRFPHQAKQASALFVRTLALRRMSHKTH